MAQVVEVRFQSPANSESLFDRMILASSHKQAIDLAMREFSGGVGVIKDTERVEEESFIKAGANSCWRSVYSCTVEDDEFDREMLAVLFAPFKSQENSKK